MESFPSNFYQEPASHNPFSWTDNTVLRRRIGRSNHLQKIEPDQMLDCLHTVGCIRHIIRSFRLVTVSVFSLFLVCMCIYMYIYEKGEGGSTYMRRAISPEGIACPASIQADKGGDKVIWYKRSSSVTGSIVVAAVTILVFVNSLVW